MRNRVRVRVNVRIRVRDMGLGIGLGSGFDCFRRCAICVAPITDSRLIGHRKSHPT